MAIDHISTLRSEFPGHFENRDPGIPVDKILRIPTLEPDPSRQRTGNDDSEVESSESREVVPDVDYGESLEDWIAEQPTDVWLEPLSDDQIGVYGDHPGGVANDPRPPGTGRSTIIERLAFYLPFHSYPDWWGIYIFPEGILKIRQELAPFFLKNSISPRDQVKIAKRILYYHEYYHHATESFATRLEGVFNQPCYLNGFTPLYRRTHLKPQCYEEACANSYAREKTIEKRVGLKVSKSQYRSEINRWFKGMPDGYAEAKDTGADWGSTLRPGFFESCLNECLPLLGIPARKLGPHAEVAAWLTAGHFDRGIGDVRSRISYMIQKGSPLYNRLPTDVRTCIKGRSFKQKLRSLGIGRFLKQGGAHELWVPSSGEGRPVPIPRHDGVDIPKGTMREILRQLGSTMSIDEFMRA